MRILVAFSALSQVGGEAFEDSGANRSSIARVWHLLAGGIAMAKRQSAGGDAGVRIGDRLLLIECFSYELPLDYESASQASTTVRMGIWRRRIGIIIAV